MQTATVLSQDYGGRVQVVDNHRISVTQRHSVMDALKMAEQGMSAAQIRNLLEQMGKESVIYLGVETLEYLKRSGRVTGAAAAIGSTWVTAPAGGSWGGRLFGEFSRLASLVADPQWRLHR